MPLPIAGVFMPKCGETAMALYDFPPAYIECSTLVEVKGYYSEWKFTKKIKLHLKNIFVNEIK